MIDINYVGAYSQIMKFASDNFDVINILSFSTFCPLWSNTSHSRGFVLSFFTTENHKILYDRFVFHDIENYYLLRVEQRIFDNG